LSDGVLVGMAASAQQIQPSTMRAAHCRRGSPHIDSQPELLMNLHVMIGPLIALIAGILLLVAPRLLNYIVAIYLIVIGLMGIVG